jgi:cold shock CspA family protein
MMTGTIEFVSPRLWGFIGPTEQLPDIYFHASCLSADLNPRDLKSGMRVEYEVGTRNQKPIALNVRKVAQ